MGVDAMEIGIYIRKAALLGTLLSFGNPNIPEVEEDEKEEKDEAETERTTQHEISSLKTGVVQGDLVVEKDQTHGFSAETCSRDIKEKSEDKKDLTLSPKTHDDVSTAGRAIVIGESEASGEIHDREQVIEEESELQNLDRKLVIEEEEREFQDQGFRDMRELHEKEPLMEQTRVELQFSEDGDRKEIKVPHMENDKPAVEFPSSHSDEPFGFIQDFSSWKEMEELDDDSLDSDSDGAESSSPDASMADIIPMLDELHPLLDNETPQPAFIPLNDSDAASERSNEGSGEDVENQEEEDDDEEDGAQQGAQEDGTKAIVTWTEDDERNLMDLGNSELERNRRLESLIARRRARKNFRTTLAEKNLIDLDASDPPFPIAPISTARHNPFDIHYDSNEAMGLPPIPGSAPSVLLPRRNPFDLPYDPLEERPDLTGGSFEEEFLTAHEKDLFFRRYESFSLGSSFFGDFKQEKQHSKFRPYFVAEQSERVGYPTFQRQLSGRSDSKVSSVAETESLSSVADQDDHKNFNEQELSHEGKPMPTVEHTPDNVKLQSPSSSALNLAGIDMEDKADADVIRTENKGADGENAHEREANLLDTQSESLFMETKPAQVYMKSEVIETNHTRSSSSSSSEVNEKIFHVNTDEANPDPINDGNAEEDSNNSRHSSVMDSDLTTRVVGLDDHQTKEPVYDWSPSVEKTLSGVTIIEEALCYVDKGVLTSTSSFIESDKQVDALESRSALVSEERTNLPADDKFFLHQDNVANDTTSGIEGSWAASSHLSAVEENEMRSREVTVISEHDVIKVAFSGDNQNFDDPSVQMVPSEVEQVLSDTDSSSSDTESEDEEAVNEEADPQFQQAEAPLLSFDQEMDIRAPQFDTDEADSKASSIDLGGSSESLTFTASEKLPPLLEKSTVQSSSDCDHEESEELPSPMEMSIKEANFINEFHGEVVNDHESRDSSDLFPSISGHFSLPMDVSQDKLPVCQVDFEDDLRDAIQDDVSSPVCEHLDVPRETIGFEMSEKENMLEGIKEIDEGLLTELDAVGDFHVEELGTNTSHTENKLVVGAQESHTCHKVVENNSAKDREYESDKLIETEVGVDQQVPLDTGAESVNAIVEDQYPNASERNSSELHVVEASSIEDIDSVFEQPGQRVEESSISEVVHEDQLAKEMEVSYSEVEPHNEGPNQMQTVGELPVLEARCVEDVDSTSEQEHESEFEKPIVPELNEETVLGEAGAGSKVLNKNPNEIGDNLELPVLEARSLEDIDSVFKQLHEGEVEKPVFLEPIPDALMFGKTEVSSADIEHANHQDHNSMEMEPSAIKERSLEDKDSASKQLEEGEIEKPVSLEPIQNDPIMQGSNIQSAEREPADRGSNSNDFDLKLLEARSVEDLNSAFCQLDEGSDGHEKHKHSENGESRPQVLESQDSAEITSYSKEAEVRSIEEIDLAPKQASSEGKMEDLQKENSEVCSSVTLAMELETATETKSYFEGSVVHQDTKAGVEESKPGSIETSEGSSSRKAGVRKEKSGSSKSSSSSSSSSSDSD